MARQDDFKTLAQDITASFDERMAVLASIKKDIQEMKEDVHRMLEGIHRERSENASNLRKNLSKSKSALKRDTSHLLKGFEKEHQESLATWSHLGSTMKSKRGGIAGKTPKHQ